MHNAFRNLPSLDFLRGFEAAGRLGSFTLAAHELFLTQSALSRQVKALEDALGVALFERRHRALALTEAGAAFHRDISETLRSIARAAASVSAKTREPILTITTTVSFASLWLIPRLPQFRARHPRVEVYVSADDRTIDLGRGEVDIAVRYLGENAPATALRLFGERILPVVSRAVTSNPRTPLKRVADLAHHVLLHLDDPEGRVPWINWQAWLAANGAADLKPAGSLRFSLYDQVIQAALGGQGVALGRLPMVGELLAQKRLVAPFSKRYESQRSYYVLVAPHAQARADVVAFVEFLRDEARRVEATPAPLRARKRSDRQAHAAKSEYPAR
ncbi:MAG TPA: LysR substrate-binding domain-containing protein [Casimicrobiaceae bacterium]|nr:LysR substrate-binding domain-containing protein [Casimicrobiaceae bacterium]